MAFEHAFFLYALILVPLFIGLFIWRHFVRLGILRQMGDKELIEVLSARISPFRRQVKSVLWLVALAALVIAIARPVWGVEREVINKEGVQIVFAIDVSRSMDANDVSPSRLVQARLDIMTLLQALAGHDIGFVVFTKEAYIYMPMTYDVNAATVFLDDIDTTMITQQGTDIALAIERAMSAFEGRSQAQRVIILMSDGENHGDDAIVMAQRAAEAGIRLYTIGYGTQDGANIPIYNDQGDLVSYQTRGNGQIITSHLYVNRLQEIAHVADGFYISGDVDLRPLVSEIGLLAVGDIGEEVLTRPIERFQIFLLLAVIALSAEMLLPETRGDDA